ncbi:hypothetical protein GW17_00042098 [Ensete ventricosum]|nr:hypothetical protein GW17_00042098 [Ensete ventricosum]
MNIYHLCQNLSTLRLLLFLVQFSMSGNYPYHKSCYKELYHPKCDVCKQFVSTYLVKRLYIKVISFSVRGIERLLTGSILAHEMMHAWLRLKGYRSLSQEVEEGICQVLAHMWLDSEIISGSGSNVASTSSSSSASTSSKKGSRSQFERKLGDFFKHQIESDTSPAYGDGFRAGNQAVLRYGLRPTLDHIKLTGTFPC